MSETSLSKKLTKSKMENPDIVVEITYIPETEGCDDGYKAIIWDYSNGQMLFSSLEIHRSQEELEQIIKKTFGYGFNVILYPGFFNQGVPLRKAEDTRKTFVDLNPGR